LDRRRARRDGHRQGGARRPLDGIARGARVARRGIPTASRSSRWSARRADAGLGASAGRRPAQRSRGLRAHHRLVVQRREAVRRQPGSGAVAHRQRAETARAGQAGHALRRPRRVQRIRNGRSERGERSVAPCSRFSARAI
jgi:hypothetical protein